MNVVKLYDLRTFDKGPFATFLLRHQPVEWTGIKFSPGRVYYLIETYELDGKLLLLPTTKNKIFLMDSFNGDLKQTFTGFPNSSGLHLEASFSPDGQYVLSGLLRNQKYSSLKELKMEVFLFGKRRQGKEFPFGKDTQVQ